MHLGVLHKIIAALPEPAGPSAGPSGPANQSEDMAAALAALNVQDKAAEDEESDPTSSDKASMYNPNPQAAASRKRPH